MFIPLLTTLTIGAIALTIKTQVTEEIEVLGAEIVIVICLFLSLIFAPIALKLLLLILCVINHKANMATSSDLDL